MLFILPAARVSLNEGAITMDKQQSTDADDT
jgi:hypothetical protein